MKNRIKALRKALNLTQENFGEKLGVRKTAISKIENGENNLTEQMIKLTCNEFNVNEHWLRTGEGGEAAMFNKLDTDERLSYALGKILAGDDEFVKRTMLSLAELDKDQWAVIKNLVKKIAGETI